MPKSSCANAAIDAATHHTDGAVSPLTIGELTHAKQLIDRQIYTKIARELHDWAAASERY